MEVCSHDTSGPVRALEPALEWTLGPRAIRTPDGGGHLPGAMSALRPAHAIALLASLLVPAVAAAQGRGRPDRYDETFRKYSKRYFGAAYDWRVFKAQGLAESNLDSTAHSGIGARGVMQLMPSTFREIAS